MAYIPNGTYVPTTLLNIVGCGDSLMSGAGAVPQTPLSVAINGGRDPLGQVLAGLDARTTAQNWGVGGQTLNTLTQTYAAANIDPRINPARTNILFIRSGTNDFFTGTQTVAQLEALIQSCCNARKTAGWNKVVVFTITPRSDATTPANFDTNRVAYNTWLRANYATFADALVDIGGDANMGAAGQELNTTYYNTDKVHHNNYGYNYVSRMMRQALGSFGVLSGDPSSVSGFEPSEIFIPAGKMASVSGSPVLTLDSSTPVWQLRHGFTDGIASIERIPEDWLTFNTEVWYSNTTGNAGNFALRADLHYIGLGSNLTTNQAGAQTTTPNPAAYIISTQQLRAGDAGDVTKRFQVILLRLGTAGADTDLDTCDVIGVRLVRAT